MDDGDITELLQYGKIMFPVKEYWLTYKCTRCGDKWTERALVENRTTPCRFGCTDPHPMIWLVRVFRSLFTRKPAYGVGELVEAEEFFNYRDKEKEELKRGKL